MSNIAHAPHGISLGPYALLVTTYVGLFGGALISARGAGFCDAFQPAMSCCSGSPLTLSRGS